MSLYEDYAAYWKEHVHELADHLEFLRRFHKDAEYGTYYIKRVCDQIDSTPGAPQALIEAGYLFQDINKEVDWVATAWYTWRYPSPLRRQDGN